MIAIRKMEEKDIMQVWELMKDLATYEGYIDTFAITPKLLKQEILEKKLANCLLADSDGEVVGILVYFYQFYTAQHKPYMHMKELIVKEGFQGQRIGTQLFEKAKEIAKVNNCWSIKWTVADWNEKAKVFYKRQGAEEDRTWINYTYQIDNSSE
ncbi:MULTISPECIES: GNAT family N-acetyltransferase [Aerococcus]|uniref:GNAT family N-acetyltransferase n=2 Tax=Aerococcus TaxID=1375 RepID=A0A1E9PHV5_9LACT|nr:MULTISPECIES: GNAT family N-acetyltransferase [Aerococcus]MBU5611273.1 GNAT family N-acetyltransferase [Aerococcus urinae]MCY3035109.1 GNAT family N-acetyltransferase [Aerococcus mictus]MCY3065819.1 GNAT family N-acetyltransferase [Aerococcus mictus]MCY3066424.1 GNAT family N-acetyltransferase [Aerococcus mictus]MCY3071350.1 GNAT family N-acetyltransferase [Aerococcus mictus]